MTCAILTVIVKPVCLSINCIGLFTYFHKQACVYTLERARMQNHFKRVYLFFFFFLLWIVDVNPLTKCFDIATDVVNPFTKSSNNYLNVDTATGV